MRKLLLAALTAAIGAAMLPAQAGHQTGHEVSISFDAPVPCMVYCAYWLDTANIDLDGDGREDIYFDACGAPFPEGSYDDVVVTAPSGAKLLIFEIYPPLDWDSFICSKPAQGNNGQTLGTGAIAVGQSCDGILGPNDPTGTGCAETAIIEVIPGKRYVLRAYNWQDVPTIQGKYVFRK